MTTGEVRAVIPCGVEDPRQLVGRVLAVRVQVGEVLEAVLLGVAVARLQRGAQADVEGEDGHLSSRLTCGVDRVVMGAVIDDEDRRLRELLLDLGDHGLDALALVPRREEDQGLALVVSFGGQNPDSVCRSGRFES
jgi:hypothetical protein